jgi:hypothetical protein
VAGLYFVKMKILAFNIASANVGTAMYALLEEGNALDHQKTLVSISLA